MPTYHLFWSPEGRQIAVVTALDIHTARRKAPRPYRAAIGEIYALEVAVRAVCRMYEIKWFTNGECRVYSLVTGAHVETYSHGAWGESGRLPGDVEAAAMLARPL